MRRSLLPIGFLTLILLPSAQGQDRDPLSEDEQKLKSSFQQVDGPSLVSFLRTRAAGSVSQERMNKLIEALDSTKASERYQACAELIAIGSPAVPGLRRVAREVDTPETAALARQCLKLLEEESSQLTIAAVRLLTARKPQGTAEALLAYLPHAENDSVMDELKTALAAVAYENGRPSSALVHALSDEHPLRRASAVTALCANGVFEPRELLRKLLNDPMPSVRLRAALSLAQAQDAKAVSTLIVLLGDLPEAQAREVEGYLQELAGEQAPKVTLGNDASSRAKVREAWAKWWLDTEGTSLLDELKSRTITGATTSQVQSLIEKLGDDSFEVRQNAEIELKKLGSRITPLLREALKNPDLEIRNRAAKCLAAIENDKTPPLSPVTIRLIALRKPKGAVEALLDYLPFAEDEAIADEIQLALTATAYSNNKAHQALLQALTDKLPVRRAAAILALANGPCQDYLPQLRELLKDKDPTVRVKSAIALAPLQQPDAVLTAINVLRESPGEPAVLAEDFLFRLARDNPPQALPDGESNRGKRANAWEKWWSENKATLTAFERSSPTPRLRDQGYTLLVQASNNMLVEWDKERKVRWQMTGLSQPWDAQWLPGNRILIAEYNAQMVTERNLKGDILWQVKIGNWPMQAERLTNGRTFVVCRNALFEFDRGGRQVTKIDRPASDIMTARRLPNGQIVVVTQNRQIIRLDRQGREIKTATIPNVFYNQNEILNNGNVLVPMGWMNAVAEYNSDGKEVSRFTVTQPMHALRLANGHTLVSSQNWPYRIYEHDKAGNQIGDYPTNNAYVFRIRRR